MIWLKRLVPFVLLVMIFFGYKAWQHFETARREADIQYWAGLTATIWDAAARFHDDPAGFLAFRDSVLAAHDLTVADVRAYLEKNKNQSEKYIAYVQRVNYLMDSMQRQRLIRESNDTSKSDTTPVYPLIHRR